MEILFPAFLALWIGGPAVAAGLWIGGRFRARRRNARGECAMCRQSWVSTSAEERYLIQGRLICSRCAGRARQRIAWQLIGLAGCTALATGLSLQAGALAIAAIPVVTVTAGVTGALHLMKRSNRQAQNRIAAGKLPLPE